MSNMLKGQNFNVLDCLSAEATLRPLVLIKQGSAPPVEQTVGAQTMMARKEESVCNVLETDRTHVVFLRLVGYCLRKRCKWLLFLQPTLRLATGIRQYDIASVLDAPNQVSQKREFRTVGLIARNHRAESKSHHSG